MCDRSIAQHDPIALSYQQLVLLLVQQLQCVLVKVQLQLSTGAATLASMLSSMRVRSSISNVSTSMAESSSWIRCINCSLPRIGQP
jgi:hypothetical protein